MQAGRSLWRWYGIWGISILLGIGIFIFFTQFPSDGAIGDLESFTAEGFQIKWILEDRPEGLQVGDVILQAEGRSTEAWLQSALSEASWRAGDIVTYQVQRQGQVLPVTIRLQPVSITSVLSRWAIQLVVILILSITAGLVFWKRPHDLSARLFVLCCLMTTLHAWRDGYNFSYTLLPGGWPFWSQLALEHFTYNLAWALGCHFFLVFPRPHPWLERFPRLVLAVVYGTPWVGMLAAMAFAPSWSLAIQASDRAVIAASAIQLIVCAILLFRSARVLRDAAARAQARWVAWGALAPAGLVGAMYFLPIAFGVPPVLANPFVIVMLAFVPVVMGVAMVRYRLWDIDFIINRSLVYGALTALVVASYLLSVTLLQTAFRAVTGQASDWAIVAATVLSAYLFQPLHQYLQNLVDRRFYREKLDFRAAFQAFARDVHRYMDLSELLHVMVYRLTDLFHSSVGAVYLYQADAHALQLAEARNLTQAAPTLPLTLRQAELLSTGEPMAQTEPGPFAVLVPLMAYRDNQRELIGALALGPKGSEMGYGYEDLALLTTLVNEAGTAISLAQAIAEKQRAQHEREAAQAATRESEDKFSKVFYLSPVPITLRRVADRRYVDVNESFLNLVGYRREEILGRTAAELDLWDYPPAYDWTYTGPLSNIDVTLRKKSGETVTALLFRDIIELGGEPYFIGTALNITDRKQAETELQASRAAEQAFSDRLTVLSEVTTELSKAENLDALCRQVVILGRERLGIDRLAVLFISEDRTTLLGTFGVDEHGEITDERQERVVIQPNVSIFPVIQGQTPQLYIKDARLYSGPQMVGSGPRVTSGLWDGHNVIGLLSADNLFSQRPFTEQAREILRLYASAVGHLCTLKRTQEALTHLTAALEQRVAERTAQLEFTNRELDAFNFSISHDLRAPLRSVEGFSQALEEDYADQLPAQAREYLARIQSASLRMGELINDLLTLSRLTRSSIQRVPVDLSTLAQTIFADLRATDPERQAEVTIAPGLQANADPRLLRIVLENLLGNAWKFTGKCSPARIEFAASQTAGQTMYYVRDNGAGFDLAHADRLFGVFQRLHSANEFEGTGIGLTIVQRIIHRHGGRVWAEAKVEQGATFYFTLEERRPD